MKKILQLLTMTALFALALMLLCGTALGEEKAFTTQPADCTVPINGTATVSWEMNFVPDKLELRTYNDNFGTDLVDTLSRLYNFHRFNWYAEEKGYFLRAYYRNSSGETKFLDSRTFYVTNEQAAFTLKPPSKIVVPPQRTYLLQWETNVTPTKVELMCAHKEYETIKIILNTFTDVVYREEVYRKLKSTDTSYDLVWPVTDADYFFVRVHYKDTYGKTYTLDSNHIEITNSSQVFLTQPKGGTIPAGGDYTIHWSDCVNRYEVKIIKCTLGPLTKGEWYQPIIEKEFDVLDKNASSYTFHWGVPDAEYYIVELGFWDPYNNYHTARSDRLYMKNEEAAFTRQPVNSTIPVNGEVTVYWNTNVTADRYELIRAVYFNVLRDGTVLETMTGLTGGINFDNTTDTSKRYGIRAYYTDGYGKTSYVDSNLFRLTNAEADFVTQPEGGVMLLGESYTAHWTLNFTPVRGELWKYNSNGSALEDVITSPNQYAFDPAKRESGVYFLRMYYETGKYVRSQDFFVLNQDEFEFTVQPQSGVVGYGQDYTTFVNLNITPSSAAVEYRARGSEDEWTPYTPVDLETMLARIPYSASMEDYEYRVSARAGANMVYATSNPFTVDLKRHTVTFDLQGRGAAIAPQQVREAYPAVRPDDPTSSGMRFGGWYLDAACTSWYDFKLPVMEDFTLYAKWGYPVEFDGNYTSLPWQSSALAQIPATQYIMPGGTVNQPSYFKDNSFYGWHVTGWYLEKACVNAYDFSRPVTSGLKLYARWEYDGYTITYNWNAEHHVSAFWDGSEKVNIEDDAPVTLYVRTGNTAAEIKPGSYDWADYYAFAGWYLEPECVTPYDFTAPISGNCTVYAHWGCNYSLTAHFLMNGAELYNNSYTIPYGTAPQDDPWFGYQVENPSSYEGYEFLGWFTDESCTSPFALDVPLTAASHVYAAYVPADYPVIFHMNDGTDAIVDTLYLHKGETVTPTAVTPVREGYTFMGWNHFSDVTWARDISKDVCKCEPRDYYAVWALDGGIPIAYNPFRDSAFRNFIAQNYDLNSDNYLSTEEIEAVTSMDLGNIGASNLNGLYVFYKLQILSCGNNSLTDLYITNMPELTRINCYNNQISSITLRNLPALTWLNAHDNSLTSLDITGLNNLNVVYLMNNPALSDVTLGYGNENLLQLHLQNTAVTSLDLSGCVPMAQAVQTGQFTDAADYDQYFVVYNGDRSLIVPKGTTFVIGGIPIDETHFPDAGLRQYLSNKLRDKNRNGALSDDEIRSITSIWADSTIRSLEGWDYLPYVTYVVSYHDLESIDLSGHPNVDTLVLKNSKLTQIDVSDLSHLTHLDVSGSTGLETMILGEAPLETLNCYGCPLLRTLDLSCQPQLLKAYLDGWSEMHEDGVPYMYYTWQNEGETLLGFLRVDPDVRFSQPHWSWTGKESASFVLPNGTACPAQVTREVNEDSTLVTYTALALLGEVPFEDSKTFGLITYFGTNAEVPPEQEFAIGTIPEVPQDPFLGGSLFDGWYTDSERTAPCDFGEARTEGLMVYAKWITPDPDGMIWLPNGLREIESEAFSGIRAQAVLVPRSVSSIAADALAGSAIQYMYGYPGSRAEEFAAACGCMFVPVDDEWIESHR